MKNVLVFFFAGFLFIHNSCSYKKLEGTIIYFNDAHEISPVIDNEGERGGIARLKTIIDNIQSKNENSKVIFGGDLGGGSLFGAVFNGFPIVEAFNQIPIDYASFGQHDFDFGTKVTQELINESNFIWITSNLVDTNGNTFAGLQNHLVVNINGIKVGILGLTDAMSTTTPNSNILQNDLIQSSKRVIKEINKQEPDIIVAITQTVLEINQIILKENPDIDVVFTEEVSETISKISYIGNRPIISTCGNIGSVAQLNIIKNKSNTEFNVSIHTLNNEVAENPVLLKYQNKYQNKLDSSLNVFVANVETDLDAGISGDFKCRWGETNIGNLITDSYRNYYDSDIAIINGGGIRANINKGELTLRNAIATLPFGNSIVKIKLTGKEISAILEHGVGETDKKGGQFLQISGASYIYNSSSNLGEKIKHIEVNNKPIVLGKNYTLALPEYILQGGNNFKFGENMEIIEVNRVKKDIDIFIDYCKEIKNINHTLEGRIKITENILN